MLGAWTELLNSSWPQIFQKGQSSKERPGLRARSHPAWCPGLENVESQNTESCTAQLHQGKVLLGSPGFLLGQGNHPLSKEAR